MKIKQATRIIYNTPEGFRDKAFKDARKQLTDKRKTERQNKRKARNDRRK